jgi:tetratricopeptide (TPR) repeat protein
MALWQARNMDDFLATGRRAIEMSENGDYLNAKPIFMESVDGLNALLPPDHTQTIKVLESFVEQAVANRDFDEAITRLHASYNDHKDKLGSDDKMTWLSLARLGRLYKAQFRNNQAYHMLFNAREGLLAAIASREDAFICTVSITTQLIDIAVEQCNIEEAESESLRLISQAQALGSGYERDALLLKHNLVHLYSDHKWRDVEGSTAALHPRPRIEEMLLNTIHTKGILVGCPGIYICSYEKLRRFYSETGQLTKLESLLPDLESAIEKTRSSGNRNAGILPKIFDLHKGIAESFMQLGDWEKAGSWLFRLKKKIEQTESYGPQCFKALSNIMQIASFYLDQGDIDNARHWFENAQQLGRQILPPEHKFHSYIARAIDEGFLDESSCYNCLVNPKADVSQPHP